MSFYIGIDGASALKKLKAPQIKFLGKALRFGENVQGSDIEELVLDFDRCAGNVELDLEEFWVALIEHYGIAKPSKVTRNVQHRPRVRVPEVFFCFSSRNRSLIETVYSDFEAELSIWMDMFNISPGTKWAEEIEKTIGGVRAAMVFVDGEDWGDYQMKEVSKILSKFPDEEKKIIPCILPGWNGDKYPDLEGLLGDLGKQIGEYHWIDFREYEEFRLRRTDDERRKYKEFVEMVVAAVRE